MVLACWQSVYTFPVHFLRFV